MDASTISTLSQLHPAAQVAFIIIVPSAIAWVIVTWIKTFFGD